VGVKERHDRQRDAVRQAILQAARELFVAEGYGHVSLRKIAERIEYSPAAIYGYFASKDDIFLALAEEGFRALFARIDEQPPPSDDPLDAVRHICWSLYEFSKDHPEYFALLFVERAVPRISRDWQRFGFVRQMRDNAHDIIRRCVSAGCLPPHTDPPAVFRLLVTGMKGVAGTRLSDRLAPGEDADALARDMLETLLRGLQSGLRMTFTDRMCAPDAVAAPAGAGEAGRE
jgi:AcrR family transcriptional regulator